ncbi:MAG: hypothetical protein QW705_02870 [Zestosphaera sp.]
MEFGHVVVEGPAEEVAEVLRGLSSESGVTEDLEDTLRILSNFDVFHGMLRRKFKEYIAPRRSEGDLISGRVLVDKVKLHVEGGVKKATVIFDKRVPYDKVVRHVNNPSQT